MNVCLAAINCFILYQDGWTALQSASSLGYTDVVRELLCKSKSIDNKNQVPIFFTYVLLPTVHVL